MAKTYNGVPVSDVTAKMIDDTTNEYLNKNKIMAKLKITKALLKKQPGYQPKKKVSRLKAPTEHEIQKAVFDVLKLYETKFPEFETIHAVPNGSELRKAKTKEGNYFTRLGKKMKDEGLRPGIPDIHVPYASSTHCGLYIEMKRSEKEEPTDHQKSMADKLRAVGNDVVLCFTREAALFKIFDYTIDHYADQNEKCRKMTLRMAEGPGRNEMKLKDIRDMGLEFMVKRERLIDILANKRY